jgi:hypothetical protein
MTRMECEKGDRMRKRGHGAPEEIKGDILECHEISAQTQSSEQFVAT